MVRTLALATALTALTLPTFAQTPGGNFITNWDGDGNGAVSLAEVTERRSDLFVTFDENEDGMLDATELATMDDMSTDMRASMQDERPQGHGQGQGKGMGQGKGQGNGMGKGQGGGKGQGQRMGKGQGQGGQHDHASLDTDGDGLVSKAEFVGSADTWFAQKDRNQDGVITSDDFGRGH